MLLLHGFMSHTKVREKAAFVSYWFYFYQNGQNMRIIRNKFPAKLISFLTLGTTFENVDCSFLQVGLRFAGYFCILNLQIFTFSTCPAEVTLLALQISSMNIKGLHNHFGYSFSNLHFSKRVMCWIKIIRVTLSLSFIASF